LIPAIPKTVEHGVWEQSLRFLPILLREEIFRLEFGPGKGTTAHIQRSTQNKQQGEENPTAPFRHNQQTSCIHRSMQSAPGFGAPDI
jgi:hypothetical protein